MKRTRKSVIPGKVVEVERGQTMKIFGGHVHKLGLHLKSNEKTRKGF